MVPGAAVTVALTLVWVVLLISDGEEGSPESPSGRMAFLSNGCSGCHTLGGTPGNAQIGPDLTRVEAVADSRIDGLTAQEYIRQALREPQAFLVPGYGDHMPTLPLSDEDVDALVELLLTPSS